VTGRRSLDPCPSSTTPDPEMEAQRLHRVKTLRADPLTAGIGGQEPPFLVLAHKHWG